jgi:phosphoribosylanthranilate isomerase
MWPKAKRSVSDTVAASISAVATQHNSATVGVFVDEDAETIMRRCSAAGVGVAQLHGPESR